MKPFFICQTTAAFLGLGLALSAVQAKAATFDQKDLDSNQAIAVAVPLPQGNRYNLLIVEQLSNTRPCWQEKSDTPGAIEPLLLQFDFTNICGRSTDSNGYSIRIAGEDKGLDYRLSILKQGDRLKLMGLPSRNTGGPALEIAHTEGLAPGFLKLVLNPEWQFAKRTYQGKTLGHIYLARRTDPARSEGGASTPYPINLASSPTSRTPFTQRISSTENGARVLSSSPFQGRLKAPVRSLNKASAYSGSVTAITAPVEIQVPEPPAGARLPSSFSSSARPLPQSAQSYNGLPTLTEGVLPVPAAEIPMGRAGNEPDLIDANTPGLNLNAMVPGSEASQPGSVPPSSLQGTMTNYRFRVYVNPADASQQRTVKTLVPGSFRASYQGKAVLQVGAFQDRAEADEVMDLLNRNGITSILSASNPG
jgi:Protein of unknown function (DUF3747)